MLRVTALESRYGRIPALKGIDLRVEAGELVALVGANGAGKTTLLRAISGVQGIATGRIEFCGEDVTAAPPEARVRRGMIQVPEGRQVFGPLSVEDNLRLGAYRRGRAESAASLERVYAMFPDLAERRAQPAGTLSGGQQQMLAMGRALMARPRLLLLDEPSMGLAPRLVAGIFACVAQLRADDSARHKLLAFALSAGIAALAGALTAHYAGFITPGKVTFLHSIELVVMVVFGGMASTFGAVVGAAVLTALPQLLTVFKEYEMVVFGGVMMLTMIFMPRGLVPTLAARRERAP